VLLAELEIRHTRAVVPTRRVALGDLWLPTDPAPGHGGVLLAAIVGAVVPRLDEETRDDVEVLIDDLQRHRHISQPRVRFRFQTDVVGLDRSRHRLVRSGGSRVDAGYRFELDDHGPLLPQALGAVYAAAHLGMRSRPQVFRLVRRATRWEGGPYDALIDFITGDEAISGRTARGRDEHWALTILGFRAGAAPTRGEILGSFRQMVRDVHPDHGAESEGAGARIQELTEAKRILLT
jgi:hypothetical protein